MRNQYRDVQKDFYDLERILEKMKKIMCSSEFQIDKARISAKMGDFDNLYAALEISMPDKVKVAGYLVH